MADEDIEEMRALVIGFLQQSLKDQPQGYTIAEFERFFPEKTDEPRDWYKRYKKSSTLDALKSIPEDIKINRSGLISLNLRSDKVDKHLVDLITNQRSSGKKRKVGGRPSQRVLSSFGLNRQASNNHYSLYAHQRSRINYDQPVFGGTPSSNHWRQASPVASGGWNDPRTTRSMRPPQVKASRTASSHTIPTLPTQSQTPISDKPKTSATQAHSQHSSRAPTSSRTSQVKATTSSQTPQQAPAFPPAPKVKDELIEAKKSQFKQRLQFLLINKSAEINLLYLAALYEQVYEEDLNVTNYGHRSLTNLLKDPVVASKIQLNTRPPYQTISIRNSSSNPNGKENVASTGSNAHQSDSMTDSPDKKDNLRIEFEAVEPFNLKNMLQSLKPISNIVEPPVQNLEIDETIKYKTMRMIMESEERALKIANWDTQFEQATRLRVRIRDHGCTTYLQFFRKLEKELPIQLCQVNGEWVAKAHPKPMYHEWINDQMAKGHYRVLIAMEKRYELIAYPNELYNYSKLSHDTLKKGYQPFFILSITQPLDKNPAPYSTMWLQQRTPEKIEDHLNIETALHSYKQYKDTQFFPLPKNFIKEGCPCAAYDNAQQKWCRALIINTKEYEEQQKITALLVDYGIIRSYPVENFQCILRSHLKLPVGIYYCRLNGINSESDPKVQQNTKRVLQEFTSPPVTIACEFQKEALSHEPKYMSKLIYEVILYDTRNGTDRLLADDINSFGNSD